MGQLSARLETEHRSSLELLGRAEHAFGGAPRSPAARSAEFSSLAAEFCRFIGQDMGRHFDFEEAELFPRMAQVGEADIAELLKEEHDAIRAVAADIVPLACNASAGELDAPGFAALKRLVLEMVERQVAHIQKETAVLLPLLDDLLDDQTDRELDFAYASA